MKGQQTRQQSRTRGSEGLVALLCAVAIICSLIGTITTAQESSALPAPTTPSISKAELHQALLDLTNPWTVMCVAAHPDDEDGTTLTVLRRRHGVHTVSLFSTYGEGGQNAFGPELYEELGVIRAFETVKASEIQGSEPHFLGLKDFGFSKSMEETFGVWGHDEALRRMVLKLRELRPDVIITNHDTSRGHGHHQATGQLLIEAFDAAADSKRFPEQLNRFKPWQAQRLFVRIYGSGIPDNKAAVPEKIVAVDPNDIDPVRGRSFAEQALTALRQHATQGPWPKTIEELLKTRRIEGGKSPSIRYRLVRQATNAPPLADTTLTFLDGFKAPASIEGRFAPPELDGRSLIEFSDQPARVLDSLIDWRINNSDPETSPEDPFRFGLMEARANKALAIAAGVSLTFSSNELVLIPAKKTTFHITLANAGSKPLQITRIWFAGLGKELPISAPDHLLADTDTSIAVEVTAPPTVPYTVPKADHLYDGIFFGLPFYANAEIDIEGAKFLVTTRQNLDVVPEVEIKSISPSPCVRSPETLGRCNSLNATLTNHMDAPFRGLMKISTSEPSGLISRETRRQIVLGPRETRTEPVRESKIISGREALAELKKSGKVVISIHRLDSGASISQRSVPVIFSDARVSSDLHVGYVPSFDQTLENSFAALGVEAKALSVDDIKNADLSTYETIVIDNRGYEAHRELVEVNPRLLEYVQRGGTLIVFYHKDNEWNPDPIKNRPQLSPYPLILGSERVTDENALVRFLQLRHLLVNFPNRIRQGDFKDWIQERGLYYPKDWDKRYSVLFAMNDKGEPPLRGGLLVSKYGKGQYIYTSIVWYRQLRGGIPGAYRMFANMISYGRNQSKAPIRNRRPVTP